MIKSILRFLISITYIFLIPLFLFIIPLVRLKFLTVSSNRLVWGSTPINSYAYFSKAMSNNGYLSETFTFDYYAINKRKDFDRILSEEYFLILPHFRPIFGFIDAMFRYDIFFTTYEGFFIGDTKIKFLQAQILKLAGKKIVVIPFGSDAYVYRNIRSVSAIHGLMLSYPQRSREQDKILKNINYWNKHADIVLPSFMGPDGIGRWDVLVPNIISIDTLKWKASKRKQKNNGINGTVKIVHAPNHRGCKGTEYIIKAIEELIEEGLKIDLKLLENVKNDDVREFFEKKADILIDQLITLGHGQTAVEGMSSGLTTISNLEDENQLIHLRRWTYFNECPIVSASPETVKGVLRKLVTQPETRNKLGKAGREYVEKFHSYNSATFLFKNVINFINGDNGEKIDLMNLYHPIFGKYPNMSKKINHPLINNRIIDT